MTSAKTVEEEAEAKLFKENAAKDKQLPLHYAAEKGASLNLMKLLLKANPEAAAAPDKARRPAHDAPPMLPPQLCAQLRLALGPV